MEQLIKSLPAILQTATASNAVTEAACIAAWKHVVGQGLRNNTAPLGLENRKLIVAVADRIWLKQLQTMVGQLVFRINAVLGQPLVRSIELRVAPELVEQSKPMRNRVSKSEDELPPELVTAASTITDPQLRRSFLGAATACLERKALQQKSS